jgi:hypothetical protein
MMERPKISFEIIPTSSDRDPIPLQPPICTPSAIIHEEYEFDKLPPKPDGNWTRFVCLSDTHSRAFDVPPGDVLLHSGDLTSTGVLFIAREG